MDKILFLSQEKFQPNWLFPKVGGAGFNQTFKKYLEEHQDLVTMIEEGRGKLEWERKIPDEQIQDLKDLLAADNFDDNLPQVRNET